MDEKDSKIIILTSGFNDLYTKLTNSNNELNDSKAVKWPVSIKDDLERLEIEKSKKLVDGK